MAGFPPPPGRRVPALGWDAGPWNRWAYAHVREILPTAEVWRGTGPVAELPRAEADLGALPVDGIDGAPTTFAGLLAATETDGCLIWLDGRVVHESYHDGFHPRAPHLSQSVAKSVTALAFGVLRGEGLIDPAAPVTDLLPELEATAWAGATLQQVLDMTTGVRFDETYEAGATDIALLDIAAGWRPRPAEGTPPDCVFDLILRLTCREAEHGSRFLYRSIETDVLAHAMERAARQRLPEIVSTRLWSRIGAEESASFTVDRAGYGLASGGFSATLRDYARLGRLLIEEGRGPAGRVVPADWIEDVFAGSHGLFNDTARVSLPNGLYRNQFWIEEAGGSTVLARGIHGQLILADRAAGLLAVKLSSWPMALSPERDRATRAAFRRVQAALGG